MNRQLILASSSKYRAELLSRFAIEFHCFSPQVDESEIVAESPENMAARLAGKKAHAVANRFPEAIVIGADQVAICGHEVLRKPGTAERACAQLEKLRGRQHQLVTAVHVIDGKFDREEAFLNTAILQIRSDLSSAEIASYVTAEQPLNCAGAYKIEGQGIALFDKIICDDWSGIIGLPLVELATVLRKMHVELIGLR